MNIRDTTHWIDAGSASYSSGEIISAFGPEELRRRRFLRLFLRESS